MQQYGGTYMQEDVVFKASFPLWSAPTSGTWFKKDPCARWSCWCACYACSPLLVPVSATGQLMASCVPSIALAWLWSVPGSSSMCAATASSH
eukprot:1160330-Pelagomonas_calceolata.AAC.6